MPSKTPATVQELSDDELMTKVQVANDHAAFKVIVERHQRALGATAFKILRTLPEAKDAVQETFKKLHQYRHKYRPMDNKLGGLLERVVIQQSLQILRRNKKIACVPLDEGQVSPSPSQENTIDLVRILAAGLARLSEKEAEAVIVHDLEGKTLEEMARDLETPPSTLDARLEKGRTSLVRWFARGAPGIPQAAEKGRELLMRRFAASCLRLPRAAKVSAKLGGENDGGEHDE